MLLKRNEFTSFLLHFLYHCFFLFLGHLLVVAGRGKKLLWFFLRAKGLGFQKFCLLLWSKCSPTLLLLCDNNYRRKVTERGPEVNAYRFLRVISWRTGERTKVLVLLRFEEGLMGDDCFHDFCFLLFFSFCLFVFTKLFMFLFVSKLHWLSVELSSSIIHNFLLLLCFKIIVSNLVKL